MEPVDLLARCEFPTPASVVPLGVSGGPDSVAMALLAVAAGLDIEVWHVHHGLRSSADHDAVVTRRLADRLDVPFVERRVTVGLGPDLEARARAARYDALPADVCVGHTADDRAETILMNLFRGAGPAGVAPAFDRVRRPILRLRRAETRAVCERAEVEIVDDPMNHEPAFTRVAVRQRLLPLVAEIFGRDPVPLLNRHAELVADALDVVGAAADTIDPTDAGALRAAPPGVATEALRRWLRSETGSHDPVDAAAVERVMAVVRHEVVATEVAGGHRISRTGGVLRFEARSASTRDR